MGCSYGPAAGETELFESSDKSDRYGRSWRKADKTVVASIRLGEGCEGSHDFVDAGFKLGDREPFLKKRKRGGILTHRLIIIDCVYRKPNSGLLSEESAKLPR